jgi:hypothetical protein
MPLTVLKMNSSQLINVISQHMLGGADNYKNGEKYEKKIRISVCFQRGDRLCGLVVSVLGYRSGGPGSIPGTTRKKK